jgi:hypothetical protein
VGLFFVLFVQTFSSENLNLDDGRNDTVPHPYWGAPIAADNCHRYGTREYIAKLLNISANRDGIEWCHKTPVFINHVNHEHPDICEVRAVRSLYHPIM